ncbi:pilus assembly protein TadG-related protein [Mesorhizobium sp.]|uniref:TadE/TadG family type IV pilus assembly protein n=1 Tax=Mesorhizobium sp. TaxID=1871066 RepID=UPI0025E810D4|nr:pilus assembly protein TadG-related protein [Mesorhizobium sp.]
MLGTIRRFWRDQNGIALILVSVMLPAIVGLSLLAIDMSRMNNLDNDLQKGVDALALAAAAELNGRSDSWTRAENALTNLVTNNTMFSNAGFTSLTTGNGTATVNPTYSACRSKGQVSWCFLASLPTNDSDPITSSNYAASATVTRFIQVTAAPETFSAMFPVSFSSSGKAADTSYNLSAVSVAGYVSGVCNYTPVFICNPYEMVNGTNTAGGATLEQAVTDPAVHRRLIELRTVGNNASYGPGNFGFLQPPSGVGNGAQALAETIATSTPLGCYSAQGVNTKTGQNNGPVQDAFNVRFGIKANGNAFNSPVYGPAANVRKGASASGNGNQCPAYNKLTFNGTGNMGLPNDATTPYMGGRMGDGNWDFNTYWSTNFNTTSNPVSVAKPVGADGVNPASNTNLPTRYSVYQYEISKSIVNHASNGGEVGTPPSSCQPPVTTVDRRLLYGAILDCNALQAAGNNLSGNSTNLPVEAFASFFITQPVSGANNGGSVFVELVDITGRSGNGTLDNFLRDEAQLYR